MSWDLMSVLHNALSWVGGSDVGKNAHVDGSAQAGASQVHGTSGAHDILGGMVGGFGGPMEWKGAGFGGQAQGSLTSKSSDAHLGGNAGLGAGAGFSNWAMNDGGSKLNGTSVAAGAVAPIGWNAGGHGFGVSQSTNLYSGAGGSGYTYDGPNGNGVGVKANVVPLGAADTNVGVTTPIGSANAHADNMYLNKGSLDSHFGQNKDGSYAGSSNVSLLTGAEGVNGNLNTPVGNWNAGADKVTYGTGVNVGGGYDPKTGTVNVNGGFNQGLNVNGLHTGYSTPGGDFQQSASAGSIFYGTRGQGSLDINGSGANGTFSGSGGGVNVQNVNVDGSLKGVGSYHGSLGEFSNDTQITDGKVHVDGDSASVSGSADGMGMRFKNGNFGTTIGSGPNAVNANASFGVIGNNNSITNASVTANYKDLSNPSLAAHADNISYAGWTGSDMKASVTGPGGFGANASLGSFGMDQINVDGANAKIDKNGITASVKDASYAGDLNLQNFNAKVGTKDYYQSAALGEFATDKFALQNAQLDSSWDPRKGTHLSADSASYDQVTLSGVKSETHLGDAYQQKFNMDNGTFNHFDAKNIKAGLDLTNGLNASLTDGHYSYLAGKNIDYSNSIAGGALGTNAHIGSASVLGVDAGKLDYGTTLMNSHLDVQNLSAHGLTSSDLNVGANIGPGSANVGAKQLNLLDLKVGDAHANATNFGTTGTASVNNASLDVLNAQGAHAGLGWNGKEVAGATADYKVGGAVDSANANWNLMGGTANANFKNASYGAQLSNASVDFMGTHIALPDAGAKLNASGGANVDVAHGAANANLSLAGSSVNFAGHSLTMPSWAQASGGVNMSQGAVNANLGGNNGVGANVNLSKGQFDVNVLGTHVDVAQGVRDVGTGISNTANAIGTGVSNAASTVTSGLSNAAHDVMSW